MWDAVSGQPVGPPLTGHNGPVGAVAVGRAGDRDVVVSGGADWTVRVWDAVSGQPVGMPLTGHASNVLTVAVGPGQGPQRGRLRQRGRDGAGVGPRPPGSRSACR